MAIIEKEKALDVVRQMVADGQVSQEVAEKYFPELKESEDEKIRKALIQLVKKAGEGYENVVNGVSIENAISWLEKQGKKDEEILILKDQIESLHAAREALQEAHNIELEKQGKQKPDGWSEEDRRMLIGLIDELDAIINKATPNEISVYSKYINWLKSLRPHQQWKPSDEQMEYLAKAITTLGDEGNCKTASILNDLRVELKKLRE